MNSLGNDTALDVAERFIDYCHEKERQENLRRYQYIQKKKEIRNTRKNVALLTIVVAVMLVLCITMISLEMQVRQQEKQINNLKTEVAQMKKENKEAEKRLANMVDYRWVQEEALKLGMSRVTEDRIVYYTVDSGDYMVQLKNIPKS